MSKWIALVSISVLVFIIAMSVAFSQGIAISVAGETGHLNPSDDPDAPPYTTGGTIGWFTEMNMWEQVLIILLVIGAIITAGWILLSL